MARGDFPFNRLELNLQPIVARPRVRAEIGRSVERSQASRSDMQIKGTPDVSFPGVVETLPLEDVVCRRKPVQS